MRNFKRLKLIFLFFSIHFFVHAQLSDFCATDVKVQEAFKLYPELQKKHSKLIEQNLLRDKKAQQQHYSIEKSASTVYVIPVVFHIIHQNGAENVSDAQIVDAIRVLNNDFRKRNDDTNSIVSSFRTTAADCQIEFKLAQLDPNGNCTNGIDRIYSNQTNIGDDGSKLNPWPHENYYNIWVVKNISPGGIAGYAYYPGTAPPDAEGVIVLHNYLGSIGTSSVYNSRVLTHETGHYLDLEHVWGSTNNPGVSCGDDGVSDTPITKGWTSCNLSGNICSAGVIENVQNYMEYSYCTKMFTWGQKARMVAALNSSNGSRNTLWTSGNLIATGTNNAPTLCAADFTAYPAPSALCAGETITFHDNSYNAQATAWQWTFPGGTLVASSTLTDSMPQVQYSTPGIYSVSLTASNSTSSASTTKTSFVSVNPSTAAFSSNYFYEDFENTAIPGNFWTVKDLDASGNTWQLNPNGHASGLYSVFLNNYLANPGDEDELISPSINIAAIPNPYFNFKYAFAATWGAITDKLSILVSSDCGKTWYQRKLLTGSALSTAAATFSPFYPNSSDWKQETVSISNVVNQNNVLIKFKFLHDGGNNIFIDDVNISSALGIEYVFDNATNFYITPNPINEFTQVSFILKQKTKVTLVLKDILGQTLEEIFNGELASGNQKIKLQPASLLNSGIYFLSLSLNGKSVTKKVMVY